MNVLEVLPPPLFAGAAAQPQAAEALPDRLERAGPEVPIYMAGARGSSAYLPISIVVDGIELNCSGVQLRRHALGSVRSRAATMLAGPGHSSPSACARASTT
jgi:hypothetical protein